MTRHRSLFCAGLIAGCHARLGSPAVTTSPFDREALFVAAPTGCVYQEFERVHPPTGIGEMSQCLDLPLVGNPLLAIVYSDYLDPDRGAYYLGGVAAATAVAADDTITITSGPHHQRFVASGARYVLADAADGSWI